MSFNSFWDPGAGVTCGQTVKCNTTGGGNAGINSASALYSSILGGPLGSPGTHTNNTPCSSIVMGNTH